MRFFSFLTLFVVVTAGCQQSTPTALNIDVDVSVAAPHHNEQVLSFKVPPDVIIEVDAGGDKSSATIDKLNANATYSIKLAVSKDAQPTGGQSEFTTLVQIQSSNGMSVGGPSTYTEDSSLSLDDVLKTTIESGTFPLEKPIVIGQLKGMTPITLAVRPIDRVTGG